MKITPETLQKVAHLARLELSEQETAPITENLEKVLTWMEQLNELDTSATEPLIHISEEINVFREDVAHNALSHAQALHNAPKRDAQYFRVPKVVE